MGAGVVKKSGGGGRRGRRRGSSASMSDINITPFVDVMLVLLIIFMVAAPMATTAIMLDVPPAMPSRVEAPPTIVSIRDGGLPWVSFGPDQMRPSSLGSLANDVTRSMNAPHPQDQRVFIRADAHVRYNEFMSVMNTLHRAGFHRVDLISESLQDNG